MIRLLALASAILALQSQADTVDNSVVGVNWSPFHHPSYDSSNSTSVKEVIQEDFAAIAAAGFTLVRTFYSRHGGVWLAPYAEAAGLKLALGVHFYSTESWTTKQLVAAAGQAAEYPDTVDAIFMGNENVRCSEDEELEDYTAAQLVAYIQDMRDYLEEYGVSDMKVGTVQRYSEWNSGCDDYLNDIAEAVDVIGANVYPFYVDSLTTIEANLDKLDGMVENIREWFPDHEIWITETGYPSGGSTCSSAQAPGSVDDTEEYFEGVKEWASTTGADYGHVVYYFQYFDKETEDEQDDVCNNFFGLATAEGVEKFDF